MVLDDAEVPDEGEPVAGVVLRAGAFEDAAVVGLDQPAVGGRAPGPPPRVIGARRGGGRDGEHTGTGRGGAEKTTSSDHASSLSGDEGGHAGIGAQPPDVVVQAPAGLERVLPDLVERPVLRHREAEVAGEPPRHAGDQRPAGADLVRHPVAVPAFERGTDPQDLKRPATEPPV